MNRVQGKVALQHDVSSEDGWRHVVAETSRAYGVLYLASDEAKFSTGSELVIDGGYTAQ